MPDVVLDASVAAAWLLKDNLVAATWVDEALEDVRFLVPPIWSLEIANLLLKLERQQRLTTTLANSYAAMIERLPISEMAVGSNGIADQVSFARLHQLTAYDASYLTLAIEQDALLCTIDKNLIQAAARVGVLLWRGG